MKNTKKMKYPKVSIIIPLYKKTPYFFESVGRCLELDYPDFEILIGVDGEMKVAYEDKRIKILRTNKKRTGPAEKRDIGIIAAEGEYIAFLDDDSYPEEDWLKKAVSIAKKKKVESVCGPGLTPPWDNTNQKITGAILSSFFGSGPYAYRFVKKGPCFVDDYPAYNLIVERKALIDVGGFNNKFYGGEDTALCLKLINAGKKIFYHPDIIVYHHRRLFPVEYAKQVGNVGHHRGYFVKAYPQTSLRIVYFLPAVFTLIAPLLLFISLISINFLFLLLVLGLIFYLAVILESYKKNPLLINVILPFAILVNYFSYGFNFIKGLLFTKHLER